MYKHSSYWYLSLLIWSCITVVLISSCRTTSVISQPQDVSFIYNPIKNTITPSITVFNQSAEMSVISVSIRKSQLFFSEANPSGEPMASILIYIKLYDNNLNGIVCDSAKYDFDIKKSEPLPEFTCRVPLKAYEGGSYYTVVSIYDKLKKKVSRSYFSFKKEGLLDPYNFKLYSHFDNRELFTRRLHENEYVNVRYPGKAIDTIYLFYYKPINAISPAPSVMLPEVTVNDTAYSHYPIPYSDTLPLMFPGEGIYLFSIDSVINEGITLFNFGSDYPGMTKAETMIPPLAYIATEEEMEALRNAPNKKIALDNFWIERGGNIEKAKELIRIYYFRVQYANVFFTSYKCGWLTDRGMIYVAYGPPDRLYKTNDSEKWGYKLPQVKSKWGSRYTFGDQYLWFTFRKQDNKFTENDFTLNRSQTPVSYWDQAVASWRRGSVFRLDNPKEYK